MHVKGRPIFNIPHLSALERIGARYSKASTIPFFNAWSCWSSIPVVNLNCHRFSNLTVVVEVVVHLVALVCLVAGEAQAGPELWAQAKKPRFGLCFLQPHEVQRQLSAPPAAAWVASRNAPKGEDPRNVPATKAADPVMHGHLVAGVVLGRLKLPTWQWQNFLNTTVLKLCAVLPFQPKPQRVVPGDKWHPELEAQLPKSTGTQLFCLVCTTWTFRLSGSVLPAVWPLWVCTTFHQEPLHQAKTNQPWTTQHLAAMNSLYPTAQDPPIPSAAKLTLQRPLAQLHPAHVQLPQATEFPIQQSSAQPIAEVSKPSVRVLWYAAFSTRRPSNSRRNPQQLQPLRLDLRLLRSHPIDRGAMAPSAAMVWGRSWGWLNLKPWKDIFPLQIPSQIHAITQRGMVAHDGTPCLWNIWFVFLSHYQTKLCDSGWDWTSQMFETSQIRVNNWASLITCSFSTQPTTLHPVRTCRLVVSTPRPGSPWFINGGTQLSSTINTQQTTFFWDWHASTGGQNLLPLVLECFKKLEKVLRSQDQSNYTGKEAPNSAGGRKSMYQMPAAVAIEQ